MNPRDVTADLRSDLRKGWCPGALRPMMAKDGLLVRLRITGGIVTAGTARAIADLADRHGSGLFDLSARANLQMRGVREHTLPALLDGLGDLGLLDADAESEAVRNIVSSPLAGLGAGVDIRPIVAELGAALARDRDLRGLPGKFGFLVDDGGQPSLADVAADVRFAWSAAHQAFAVGLDGTRDDATFAGICAADAVVVRAREIGRKVAALQVSGEAPCRMRNLLRRLEPSQSAELFGVQPEPLLAPRESVNRELAGRQMFDDLPVLGLAAPFGRLDAAMLRAAAAIADSELGELRLTPWRTILVPQARAGRRRNVDDGLGLARDQGFITDPADPRLRVAACTGRDGCARGTTTTHADATALAGIADALGVEAIPLHVSGCEKGCAKPSRSAVTLVGRDGRYDLVRNGRPGDAPHLRGLDLNEVRAALCRSPVPA